MAGGGATCPRGSLGGPPTVPSVKAPAYAGLQWRSGRPKPDVSTSAVPSLHPSWTFLDCFCPSFMVGASSIAFPLILLTSSRGPPGMSVAMFASFSVAEQKQGGEAKNKQEREFVLRPSGQEVGGLPAKRCGLRDLIS